MQDGFRKIFLRQACKKHKNLFSIRLISPICLGLNPVSPSIDMLIMELSEFGKVQLPLQKRLAVPGLKKGTYPGVGIFTHLGYGANCLPGQVHA